MDWNTIYEELKTRNWVILFVLSFISYLLLSPAQTLGTILGGGLIIANFEVFQHTIYKAFSPDGLLRARKLSIIAKYYFRLLAMGIIIFVLIRKEWVDPVGMAIGFSTVIISIVILGISMALKTLKREAS